MSNALKNVNTKVTVQTRKASETQVKNNAGGYVFTVSDKDRLDRFLILGTDGGTYYVGQDKLTDQNVKFVKSLIQKDEALVLSTLVDVSVNGRAYKNSPAIFTLALLFVEGKDKAAAKAAVQKVCRTSTHLFEFAQYIENLGGWGRAKRSAVADWYQSKAVDQLAYQLVKYRQRDGWTHRDLMRLSHPVGLETSVVNFALGKASEGNDPEIIEGFKAIQAAGTAKEAVSVLETYKSLPWEAVPTEFLKERQIWRTLFYNGQLNGQALLRNITRLARIGAFDEMKFAADYAARLTDSEMILKTRLHPINYLNALVVYTEGQVDRRSYGGWYGAARNIDWKQSPVIVDALNEGFHLAFKAVEPANKRTFLALDVSGSMSSMAMGIDLSCAQVAGAVAMTIARTEPMYDIKGFTAGGRSGYNSGTTELTDLNITAKTQLNAAMNNVHKANFGRTDCSLPMQYALKNKIEVDTFVVLTDSETYAGSIHPFQALKKYRDAMGIDARLAVFGVTATPFTIADPSDRGMMDFVGFDSNAPKVLADFSAGRL